MSKAKYHPFFCTIKKCRKNIKDTPEYLDNKKDVDRLHSILHYLRENDRAGFNKYLCLYTENITECGFKETVSEMFFYRVVGWPEGNRYYNEASDNWQADLFEGFRRDYIVEIQNFLKNW
jgi:hypothetical protein